MKIVRISSFLLLFLLISGCVKELPKNDNNSNYYNDTPVPTNIGSLLTDGVKSYGSGYMNVFKIISETELLVSSSFPQENLPSEGTIIYYQPDEKSSYCFVGLVTRIVSKTDGTHVITEVPPLDRVLKTMGFPSSLSKESMSIQYDSDGDDPVKSVRFADPSELAELESYSSEPEQSQNDSSAATKSVGEIPVNIPLAFEVDCEYFTGTVYYNLNGVMHFDDILNFSMILTQTTGFKGELKYPMLKTKDKQYKDIFQPKKPVRLYSNLVWGIAINPKIRFFYEGEVSMMADTKIEMDNTTYAISVVNGHQVKNEADKKKKDTFFRFKNLNAKGSFGPEVLSEIFFYPLTEKLMRVGAYMSAGLKIEGEHELAIQFPWGAGFDTKASLTPYITCKAFSSHVVFEDGKFKLKTTEHNPELSVELEAFSISLLPFAEKPVLVRKNSDLKVQVAFGKKSLMSTREEGIALFKKNEAEPVSRQPIMTSTKSSGNIDFSLTDDARYEVAPYVLINEGDSERYFYSDRVDVPQTIRELLIKLYKDTGGDNWYNNKNWCTDEPVEKWYGIDEYHDGEGNLRYGINLENNNLVGTVSLADTDSISELSLYNNQLNSIDVSGCTNLSYLECCNNQLSSIDISGCINLEQLQYSVNQPDNASQPTIDASGLKAHGCTKLEVLDIFYSIITSLDVSDCASLKVLHCCENSQLRSFDVSECSSLNVVDCHENYQLSSFDVSECSSLSVVHCFENAQLSSFNVSKCNFLGDGPSIECHGNSQLKSFIVSECYFPGGGYIECHSSRQLSLFNVTECIGLGGLECYGLPTEVSSGSSQLSLFNVSECIFSGGGIGCYGNSQFSSFNVSKCASCRQIECENNPQLSSFNVSECADLKDMYCYDNGITSFKISECQNLSRLQCQNNHITVLDISGFPNLVELYCHQNQITSLDISNNKKLQVLSCGDNCINQEITPEYEKLKTFWHDVKYEYKSCGHKNHNLNIVSRYKYGWWYPGEPYAPCSFIDIN